MLRSGASPFSGERISLLRYADFCDLISSFKENVFCLSNAINLQWSIY